MPRMMYPLDDTIAAIASAQSGAARGIVRMSGSHVVDCLRRCFVPDDYVTLSEIRIPTAIRGTVRLPAPLGALACELMLWPTSQSYTRQPSAELHTMGSAPLLEAMLATVCAAGARLAEPGEFTLRAFLAGRLDLTQAEAVLGVIDAHNQRELDVALSQLAGGLAGPLDLIRNQLLDLLAHLEAGLDFVEEDIEFISAAQLQSQLDAASSAVRRTAEQMIGRSETPDAWRVALVGWPNVGKSSLLNALAGETAALVSPAAGTTRDYLRRRVAWKNFHVELIDTAGIELAANDPVSSSAQAMTSEQWRLSHLVLLCLDASRPQNPWEEQQLSLAARGAASLCNLSAVPVPVIIVRTKADLVAVTNDLGEPIAVSSITGAGLDELKQSIQSVLTERYADMSVVAGTAARCRESLRLAATSLEHAQQAASLRLGEELIAADVRTALDEIGKVAGQIYTDDVLDRIFSRFCIGK